MPFNQSYSLMTLSLRRGQGEEFFGLNIKGLSLNGSATYKANEYLYNGKMMQDEMGLNWLDYGARFYDPVLARFHTVDPLAEKFSFQSPYCYAANNPIKYIDWMGLGPGDHYKSRKAAAIDWGKTYNGVSIIKGQEMGSSIYSAKKNGTKYYSYSEPNNGDHDGCNPSPAPSGTKTEAKIHSHGKYEANYLNNEFSSTDKWDAYNNKVDAYVSTTDGSLKMYDVETTDVVVVSTDMPSDKNDPDRKNTTEPKDDNKDKQKVDSTPKNKEVGIGDKRTSVQIDY